MRAASPPPTARSGGVPAPSVCVIIKTPALGPPLASVGREPAVTASKHGGDAAPGPDVEAAHPIVWLCVSLDAERITGASVVCSRAFSQ